MHALVVVAHPDPASLSQVVAQKLAEGVSGAGHSAEIAELAREGFDPRFTLNDLAAHRREIAQPADIAFEQMRIDRADALVLVYPVYWWSMPALMKGWIERVFANGWAYDELEGGKTVRKLQHLPVHLVAVAGADSYWRAQGFDYAGPGVPGPYGEGSHLMTRPLDPRARRC